MKYLSKYCVRSIHFKHLNGDTGGQKKTIKTMVFLEMISNNLPECCSNTCTTLNGSFTHRWRHSCKFDEEGVPIQKTEIIKKGILKTYLHNTSTAKKYNTKTFKVTFKKKLLKNKLLCD